MNAKDRYDAGLKVRREVLGADYVDSSVKNADAFMTHFQKFTTENCWGTVWTRPGLSRRDRSLLNLAMLSALGKPDELKLHVKGALTNGLTRDEIAEVFLQVGVYCGVPACLESFKVGKAVFAELDAKK